jgi:L-ribulose-5-phosphate 3-epimerase
MKLGYSSSVAKHDVLAPLEITLGKYVKEIALTGYDSCGLFTFHGQAAYPDYLSKQDRMSLKRLVRDLGVEIGSIGAYGGMLLTTEFAYLTDKAEKRYAVNYMKKCVDLAVDLECEVVEDLSGVGPAGMTEEKAWRAFCKCLKEVCDYADENNVCLAIEHLGLVNTAQKFLRLTETIRSEALKCVFDPSNMLKYLRQTKKEIFEGIRLNSDLIADVHLKGVSKDLQFVRPCSDLDYYGQRDFLEALKNVRYNGLITIEEFEQFYIPSTPDMPFRAALIAHDDVNDILKNLEG